jgi:tetratricopeptide (TPR) repeat protein
MTAIDRGDYATAEAVLAQNPDHNLLKGILEFHQGKYAAAQASLAKALEKRDDARGRTFFALSRAATGDCETAKKDLAKQFDQSTDSDLRRLAGLALSQCHLTQNQISEAFPVLNRLAALYPADADVLYQAAKLHMKAWNDAVFQMFQKVPASFRANQLSAEIFEIQGRYAEAIAEYRKAIEKNPNALNLHFRLGRALLMESHSPQALAESRKEFEAELLLNPSDAAAEYQVGQILNSEQKPNEAGPRFERALSLRPDFPEALLALGKARLDAKRYAEAIEFLERAVRLLPQSEAAHYNLMLAYRNAGKTEDALREKVELEKLQSPPEGEFTEFLKKLGEKTPKP